MVECLTLERQAPGSIPGIYRQPLKGSPSHTENATHLLTANLCKVVVVHLGCHDHPMEQGFLKIHKQHTFNAVKLFIFAATEFGIFEGKVIYH